MEPAGLGFGCILGSYIRHPNESTPVHAKHFATGWFHNHHFSVLPAASPTVEMLLRVPRSRLEGEASVGHGPRLLSSKEEAHSNCVSNVTVSHRGDLGGLGRTQLKFNSVSRRHQLPLPQGKAVCDNVVTLIHSTCLCGSCRFKQRELLSEGSCMENATAQLEEVIWSIQKRKIKKRWGSRHRARLWRHGALAASRWVLWSRR